LNVIHIADCPIELTGGMSRVAWHWKSAFEKRGHVFRHIGPEEVGSLSHSRHFPKAALRYFDGLNEKADVVLVHEPTAGAFSRRGLNTIVVSHGLERRGWQIRNGGTSPDYSKPTLKSRMFFPLWRLRGCDIGLRNAAGALLINQEDKAFAVAEYGLKESNILVFKNGVNLTSTLPCPSPEHTRNILFLASWLPRKGIHTMARAAKSLHDRGVKLQWVLAGTGLSTEEVLPSWPACLHAGTKVIPRFSEEEEPGLYQSCNLFVLPSFFEGQALSLLQAMANGRCCITTNVCGQRDVVRHRSNGLLFEPGDAPVLASLIEECSGNLCLQAELGTSAWNSVNNRSWQSVGDEVVDFVEQVVAKKEGRRV
jgi:glycosyltransferase involved in cell wall biosynthesis